MSVRKLFAWGMLVALVVLVLLLIFGEPVPPSLPGAP